MAKWRMVIVGFSCLGVLVAGGCTTIECPPQEPPSSSHAEPGTPVMGPAIRAAHAPLTRVEGEAKLRIPHENYLGEIESGAWTGTPHPGGSCTYETFRDTYPSGEEMVETGTSRAPEVVRLRITPLGGAIKLSGDCVWTRD